MPRSNAPAPHGLDKFADSLPEYTGGGTLAPVNFQMLAPGVHLVWRGKDLGTIAEATYSLDGSYVVAVETDSGVRLKSGRWASRAIRRVV